MRIISKIERNSDADTVSVVEFMPKYIKKPPQNGFFSVWVEIFVFTMNKISVKKKE